MKKYFILFIFMNVCLIAFSQETIVKYLSGTDKDHTAKWDFYCTRGMNSGKWSSIPVPSNWELQSFGGYNYGLDKRKNDEQGLYRYHFKADKSWKDKEILLVFEGVMTDAEVKLNGQSVGPVHQGAFYRFEYTITKLIKPGADNLLEVTVSKMSADSTVNHAEREGDFWVFGGIYRPVYLKILPASFIERVAINAGADGKLNTDVFIEYCKKGDEIVAQVKTLNGEIFGQAFSSIIKNKTESISLSQNFTNPDLWNPESPKLYNLQVSIKRRNVSIHTFHQRFGFRTVEVKKGDGIYVNGIKVRMKGVDRHSFWPESGRTLSRSIQLLDISLIKDMNMNAVRMSHYPPDAEFLDVCDSLGLFVLDELTGWHQRYGTEVGKQLVKEMVTRDVNHPSIIFWDNGNEGGWNTELDNEFAMYDPQKRTVLHPWNKFNNIDTKHYPDYNYVLKAAANTDILMHTEMIHGLYDGGHGAGLEDYWNLMQNNPRHAGGFLWVLADEGIIRKDEKDSIDTDGNHGPDGIVGPHREKEGSFYTIKEIWSPVQVTKPMLDNSFNGRLEIKNDYLYTNLSACKFRWQLIKFPSSKENKINHLVIDSGKVFTELAPGKEGTIQLKMPANWYNSDALTFTAIDFYGRELYTWVWPIKTPMDIAENFIESVKFRNKGKDFLSIKEITDGVLYSVIDGNTRYTFDTTTGLLKNVFNNERPISFGDGPVLAGTKQSLFKFTHYRTADNNIVIEASYSGDAILNTKWTFTPVMPAKLEFSYTETSPANYYGITFNINESEIKSMKWLGGGPYRVWKNRLKGAEINVWQKKYNNTVTGETFEYPEFKGYHANMYWAIIETKSGEFTIYTNRENMFLQMMQPAKQATTFISHVNPPFPQGNLGFLTAIAPMGTKFRAANTMGPQSQLNQPESGVVNGTLWFEFR